MFTLAFLPGHNVKGAPADSGAMSMCLSTLMLGKVESLAGIAPASAVLQIAA